MPAARGVLDSAVDAQRGELVELARAIHGHPELCFEERRAAGWVAEYVERATGIAVERGVGGLETAVRARAGSGEPRVAIFAEYDALPEIGHACGHNLIAAGAVGAFVALARSPGLSGTVELVGTPAEEGGGGKIRLMEAGVFEGLSAAMMFHPFDRDLLAHPALSSLRLTLKYRGAPAHAAMAPGEGQSALTACLDTFRLIDSQRVHFADGVRVHGIVTNGGQAVNIIPEYAESEFSLRARSTPDLERVLEVARRCAKGAALASGVEVEIVEKRGYREMWNNMAMAERFGVALRELGRSPRNADPEVGAGSTDMGDISQYVPAIHPWLAICDKGESLCHQHHFAACAVSERGFDTMVVGAKALARTAADLLEDPALLAQASREFAATRRAIPDGGQTAG
jgi:amidohydrolase